MVSLPENVESGPVLLDLLPEKARAYLEEYHERMIKDGAQEPDVTVHIDVRLRRNKKRFNQLVKELYARGLLR